MKIGIFGGTFDPFTIGHAAVLTKAFEQYSLDKVYIVPTTVNYYRPDKRYLFTFDEKVKIIQNFLINFKYNASIDSIEKDKDGNWRTIDLVQYFNEQYPEDELYLIIGEDSLHEFTTWTRWQDILKYVQLIVANRSDHVATTRFINKSLKNDSDFKSSTALNNLVQALPLDMGTAYEDCSATKVRNQLIDEIMDFYLSDKEWYNGIF